MEYQAILSRLCATMTVSGYESTGQETLTRAFAPFFDRYEVDALGNYRFFLESGQKDAHLLLLDAHIDEIGMLVSELCEGGFLRFVGVGGLDRRTLSSADVTVHGCEAIRGVITSVPPHLQSKEDAATLPKTSSLWIDTGYTKEELEARGVHVGTPVTLYAPPYELREGMLCGASFDNKACCAAALAAAMRAHLPQGWDLCVLLSAREEISGVGSYAAAYGLHPDAALVLDGNLARTPHTKEWETVRLGGGASISISAMTDRALTRALIDCAKAQNIPHQCIVEASGTGTNADLLSTASDGVPCAVVSLPLRHMHTPTELISTSDVDSLVSLLVAFIEGGLTEWYATVRS